MSVTGVPLGNGIMSGASVKDCCEACNAVPECALFDLTPDGRCTLLEHGKTSRNDKAHRAGSIGGGSWGWGDGQPLRHTHWNTAPDRRWNGRAIQGVACAVLMQPVSAGGGGWRWSEVPCTLKRTALCRTAPPSPPPPPPRPPPHHPPPSPPCRARNSTHSGLNFVNSFLIHSNLGGMGRRDLYGNSVTHDLDKPRGYLPIDPAVADHPLHSVLPPVGEEEQWWSGWEAAAAVSTKCVMLATAASSCSASAESDTSPLARTSAVSGAACTAHSAPAPKAWAAAAEVRPARKVVRN